MGARASRQDAKISSPAALSGYRFINTADRQTVYRTRQTSLEIVRGAWPLDLREIIDLSLNVKSPDARVRDSSRMCLPALPDGDTRVFGGVNCVPSCLQVLESRRADGSQKAGRCTRSVNLHGHPPPRAVRTRVTVNRERRLHK